MIWMGFLKATYIGFFLVFNFFYVSGYSLAFNSSEKEAIKIGLLIQDSTCREAQFAAELAIQQSNRNGGINGHPIQLVVRSMEGPWGTGSKQAVDLVFNENVWAILGSHDGRNAHLVEQVIAKTHVPFVSAWAPDPTLSQAFVPWFFNLVPNSNQQAVMLIDEIFFRQKVNKVLILVDSDCDSQTALKSFIGEARKQGYQENVIQFFYDSKLFDTGEIISQIDQANVDGVVIFGQPKASIPIIQTLKKHHSDKPVFCSLSVLGENFGKSFDPDVFEGVYFINPGYLTTNDGIEFSQIFNEKYRFYPGAAAAFSYDGMNLLIEAIKESQLNREQIKETLAGIRFSGITGTIEFDKNGNRKNSTGVISIKNGIPTTFKK